MLNLRIDSLKSNLRGLFGIFGGHVEPRALSCPAITIFVFCGLVGYLQLTGHFELILLNLCLEFLVI